MVMKEREGWGKEVNAKPQEGEIREEGRGKKLKKVKGREENDGRGNEGSRKQVMLIGIGRSIDDKLPH